MTETKNADAIAMYEKNRPKLKKHTAHVDQALVLVELMEVDTPEDYAQAGFRLATSKDRLHYLEGWKDEVCGPIFRAHRAAIAEFKPAMDRWKQCVLLLNEKMTQYDRKVEAQNKKRAEELRLLAENEAAQEKQELLEMAETAEARGETEQAKDLRDDAETAVAIPVPLIPARPPKIDGLKVSKRWTFEVTDIDKVPDEWVTKEIAGAKVRAEAKRTSGKCQIPGLRIYQEPVRSKA